jgi:hypothetical protein
MLPKYIFGGKKYKKDKEDNISSNNKLYLFYDEGPFLLSILGSFERSIHSSILKNGEIKYKTIPIKLIIRL